MNRWTAYQVMLFTLPLPFGGYRDWAWPWFAAVAVILLLLEVNHLLRIRHIARLPAIPFPTAFIKALPLIGLLAMVQLWVLVQWAAGISYSPFDTYTAFLRGLGLISFFALTLLMLHSRERVKRAVWIVALAAAFQALFGAVMVLTGLEFGFFIEKQYYRGVATGTFVNRNHLAGYLEMSLALGIGFLLAQSTYYSGSLRQRMRQMVAMLLSDKVVLRLLLAVMVIALVLSRSRMGNTAFFASLMLAGGLALLLMRNKSRSTTILLASLLVIDIAIVGTFFGVEKVADRLQNTTAEHESRDEVTRDTVNMWRQNLITGIGAGAFIPVYPAFRSADVKENAIYNNAHNDYAQFGAEFGLPAYLTLAAVVLWCFWWGVMAMRLRNSDLYKGMGFSACMGIIAIAIHSAVDFNLQVPANAWMFMLVLAMAVIARWAPHNAQPLPEIKRHATLKVEDQSEPAERPA
ncbi:O-antigen ligase family protein [Thalassolituus sp. LLYu03]|uniref:O-antigen ligase family protein n=1 Tax=Thalassolituus sp. LLYu03 TaxID=3421656 RepID=UPI003D266CC6